MGGREPQCNLLVWGDQIMTRNASIQLKSAQGVAPNIIGDSTNPSSQRKFAGQIPGAITAESVDLKDLVSFAEGLDLASPDLLAHVVDFAGDVMSNVGGPGLLTRVSTLRAGRAKNAASDLEKVAIALVERLSYLAVSDLLSEIGMSIGAGSRRRSARHVKPLKSLYWVGQSVVPIHTREPGANRPSTIKSCS
jgi:hypothetical protein